MKEFRIFSSLLYARTRPLYWIALKLLTYRSQFSNQINIAASIAEFSFNRPTTRSTQLWLWRFDPPVGLLHFFEQITALRRAWSNYIVKQCLKNRNYRFRSNNEKNIRGKLRRQNFVFLFLGRFFVFLLSCCTLIFAAAIVGNLMICYVIMVYRNLRNNPARLLLLSLVISDLVTLTVVAPLDIEVFFVRGVLLYGEHLCKIFTIIFVTSVPSSVWTLLPISIECLKNLSDPLNHLCRSPFLTSKRALIAIIFIWLYNVLFAAIPSMV